jgi:hypothetical protein
VISMASPSWPGVLSGASKIVNAPTPVLHEADVICEECYVADERGATLDSRHRRNVWLVTSVTARVLAYRGAARSLARSCSLPFAPPV